MTLPTLIVEVGFTAGATTQDYLHLDDSVRGLLDTGTLAPADVLTDVSTFVRTVSLRRGSTRVEGPVVRYEAGTSSTTLKNDDRRFDPTNLSGPYVSAGATQVTPMRVVRHRATWAGITYDLWRGNADGWALTYDKSLKYGETTLTATDGFKVLGNHDRVAVAAVGTGDDSGARVGRILNSVDWETGDRLVSTGDTTLQSTTLDGDALTELFLVADTEIGELYIDGAGRVVFRNRQAVMEDSRSNTSQATFGDAAGELPFDDVTLEYDDETLANLVRISRTGGTQQTAQDTTSQTSYLVRTHERTDLLMRTDSEAADYANFVLFQSKDPELRFAEITINPQRDATNLYPQVLGRRIGDRVTVKLTPPGGGSRISRDVFIRGISHEITPETWATKFTLQSATKFNFLVLDSATLGLLDTHALAY